MSTWRELILAICSTHYTREQKALMIMVAGLVGVILIQETRLLSILPTALVQIWNLRKRNWRRQSGIKLGPIFLADQDRVRHCHIVGSPGSGKTEATKLLIFEDLKRGRGCFIIDAKGDRELYEEIQAYCKEIGRQNDLKLLSATYVEESVIWNPCGLGNTSELQSKFLNANTYSEPFYAKACELGLLHSFQSLLTKAEGSSFSLNDLVEELEGLAEKSKSKTLEGLFYDFKNLALSEWGSILGSDSKVGIQEEVHFLDLVQKNQILFVHLPTEGRSIQCSRVGRLLTQELILVSGLRKSFPELNSGSTFAVYIDEFDAFATESFITFLNKGRSSNFMIHMIHQTLSDLRKVSDTFAGQVLGNCNVHLIFRQDDPDDSELWARFIGTQTTVKRTFQTQDGLTTGMSSNRETQEFLINPNLIKNLQVGECVVSVKTQSRHQKVKLPLAKSRLVSSRNNVAPFDPMTRVRSLKNSQSQSQSPGESMNYYENVEQRSSNDFFAQISTTNSNQTEKRGNS